MINLVQAWVSNKQTLTKKKRQEKVTIKIYWIIWQVNRK